MVHQGQVARAKILFTSHERYRLVQWAIKLKVASKREVARDDEMVGQGHCEQRLCEKSNGQSLVSLRVSHYGLYERGIP